MIRPVRRQRLPAAGVSHPETTAVGQARGFSPVNRTPVPRQAAGLAGYGPVIRTSQWSGSHDVSASAANPGAPFPRTYIDSHLGSGAGAARPRYTGDEHTMKYSI